MKDLYLLESERGQYLSLLESERKHFQIFVNKSSQGSGTHASGLRWQTYGFSRGFSLSSLGCI